MTIRVICKSCGSKLDAKDHLLGQVRNCPKCKNPVLIEPAPTQTSQQPQTQIVQATQEEAEPGLKIKRLMPDNLYVILGNDKEIAFWKSNEGWFLNVGVGFEQIKRVANEVPDMGDFVLVEGYVEQTDDGRRLKGLRFWKLSGRNVLNALVHSEAAILEKATQPTTLSSSQKRFLLNHIRKNYFPAFTDDAPDVVEYLLSVDAHSHSVGTFVD
ncbi:MAG: hypothetical protein Q4G03_08130 [Planctomycetia bacterium]|nr:hypothetical protein [Planctomycetia bacterium]